MISLPQGAHLQDTGKPRRAARFKSSLVASLLREEFGTSRRGVHSTKRPCHSLDLVMRLANKGRLVAKWTRCSFQPPFDEVPSAHRAFKTRYFGEYDAITGVRDVGLKRGILDPDHF